MHVSVADRVAAEPARVFAAVSDFDAITDRLEGRRLSLRRTDRPAPVGPGSRWVARLALNGLQRSGSAGLSRYDPPRGFVLAGQFDGLEVALEITVVAEGPASRVTLGLTTRPVSLAGRLLQRSLRLVEPRLSAWMQSRLSAELRALEGLGGCKTTVAPR